MIRIGGYPVDVVVSEQFRFPGEVTKYPVERGADLTDHIRDIPEEITLECVVSDTPIGEIANDPTRQNLGPEAPLPSLDALARFRNLKAARQPISVETSVGTFDSMALVDFQFARDAQRTNALFFSLQLERIVVVENKRTRVQVRTPMAGAGGKAKAKAKAPQTVPIDDRILWLQGVPPGAPFRPGGKVVEVRVHYNATGGFSKQEATAIGKASPSSPLAIYLDEKGVLIVGAQRIALIKDLERDRNTKVFGPQLSDAQQLRRDQNLPEGLDLSRFKRPAPPTFPGGR